MTLCRSEMRIRGLCIRLKDKKQQTHSVRSPKISHVSILCSALYSFSAETFKRVPLLAPRFILNCSQNHFVKSIADFWSSYIRKKQPKSRCNLNRQKPVVVSQGKPFVDNKLLVEHSLPSRRRLVRAHRKTQKKSKGPPTRPEGKLSSNSEDLERRYSG